MTGRKLIVSMMMIGAGAVAASAQQAQPAPTTAPSWVDNVTVKGDVRYRYETIDDESKLNTQKDTFERERDRIRARLGVDAKVNDDIKAGIAFSTGGSDPTSGNQTLGDAWQKKDMKLDKAFFDWTLFNNDPTLVDLIGGKQSNPFQPLGSVQDLIWDNDCTPEGLVLKAQTGNDLVTVGGTLGYMWIQERAMNNDDSMLYAGQGFVKIQPMSEASFTIGGTYYQYNSMKGYDVLDWQGLNTTYGNSTVKGSVSGSTTNKAYATEFKPIELFASLDLFVAGLPVSIYGQSVKNQDCSTTYDSGFQYGISFGKAKNPHSFELGYNYAKLEKDAVLGALTDSDRWGGGTDGKGSRVYGKYVVAKNTTIGLTYFVDDKGISGKATDYKRLQADLCYSF